MFTELGGVTSQLINLALDAAAARHGVIANNIANADTPGFKAKRLKFESELQGLVSQLQAGQSQGAEARLNQAEASIRTGDAVYETGQPVELDEEMVHLTENTILYQALLQASSKRGDLISMAVNEGRK